MPASTASSIKAPATPANAPGFDLAVVNGGFEPLHHRDVAALSHALALAPVVVVVVGAAHRPASPRHPFSWQERADMIRRALPPSQASRVHPVPVRDHDGDTARWAQEVQYQVQKAAGIMPMGSVAWLDLAGDLADQGRARPAQGWSVVRPDSKAPSAPDILTALWTSAPGIDAAQKTLDSLARQLPDSTAAWLRHWVVRPLFQDLREEWAMLQRYKASWALAPYPPVFVTVDNVVRCAGHVLLVRRGARPGKGLLALPGGFIEPRETTLASALRELREETGLKLADDALRAAWRGSTVFDHPTRSERGRTITHAFHFELGGATLPEVRAGDDAQAARWVPVADLPALETEFFEDHFHILDRVLRLGH